MVPPDFTSKMYLAYVASCSLSIRAWEAVGSFSPPMLYVFHHSIFCPRSWSIVRPSSMTLGSVLFFCRRSLATWKTVVIACKSVLTIAKINVPQGKLQFTLPATCILTVAELVQGALEPWRRGLVNTATTIKAATKRRSNRMNRMRRILEWAARIASVIAMVMRV